MKTKLNVKKTTALLLAAGLALMLFGAACAAKDQEQITEASVAEENLAEPEAPPEPDREEEDVEHEEELFLPPADTSMYRGTVTEITEEEAGRVYRLEQYQGTDFGHLTLDVVIPEQSNLAFQPGDVAVGDYLEVYYSGPIEGDLIQPVEIIAARKLLAADMVNYHGVLQSVMPGEKEGEGTLEILSMDGNETILFHYGEDTQFYLAFDRLLEGDELTFFFSGAVARSMPPQAYALEVRPYSGGEEE